jgi:hypothetical protein
MRDPIQSKLIRLYEAVNEVSLHSSPMIGKALGMDNADLELLKQISTLSDKARRMLHGRLSPRETVSEPVPYSFNAGTNSKGEPAVPAPADPITEPTGPQPIRKPKVTNRTEFHSTHKQWSLDPKLAKAQITEILGVKPSKQSCGKVTVQWDFYIDGKIASIWDYHGAKWSAYGPKELLDQLGLTVVSR